VETFASFRRFSTDGHHKGGLIASRDESRTSVKRH
jgi:hypothetical protein